MTFKRTQVYLPAAVVQTVKRLARRQRQPVAQTLRELIDAGLLRKTLEKRKAASR
jgi:hypothetical protein